MPFPSTQHWVASADPQYQMLRVLCGGTTICPSSSIRFAVSHSHCASCFLALVSKSEYLVSNLFDCNDTRSPDAHFFLGPVFEVVSRFEESKKGRRVREDFKMVEDLWDAIVGEHGQLVNSSAWEYGVGYFVRS